jgi:predicted nucleotidyltransferase
LTYPRRRYTFLGESVSSSLKANPRMRPPSTHQSALRYPLSSILSSEGNVRVLRELFRHGAELNPPQIASRAGLSPQHVRQILPALRSLGVIEVVGQGRYPSYRGRAGHPMHAALDTLFRLEEDRFDQVLEAVRKAVSSDQERPLAVWLYGSAARGEDVVGSDVDVAVVLDPPDLEQAVAGIRERLDQVEERLGVSFSVVGLDPEDVSRLSTGDPWWESVRADAIPLLGPDPKRLAAEVRRGRRPRSGRGAP